MSSHVTVKDNQEFALIIANGQPCSEKLLFELLEWSPLVVVLDSAIEKVLSLNIKIDICIGDFDNFDAIQVLKNQQDNIEFIHTPDQNYTDLEKALFYLRHQHYKTVYILWATGRRMDHTLNNCANLVQFRHELSLMILDDFSRIIPIPNHFKKWYPAHSIVSLLPVGEVKNITSIGLKYPLHQDNLSLGYRSGCSNSTEKEGWVEIYFEEGDLLLIESFENENQKLT